MMHISYLFSIDKQAMDKKMHTVLLNTAGRSTVTNKHRPRIMITVSPYQMSAAFIRELQEETPHNLFAIYTIQTITFLSQQKKRDITS